MINVVVAIKEQDVLSIKTALDSDSFEYGHLIINRITGPWRNANGLVVYDMVIEGYAVDFLLGLYPESILIGSWNEAGEKQSPFNAALWLDHQPDIIDGEYFPGDPPPTMTRPTELDQVHKWSGWADRDLT